MFTQVNYRCINKIGDWLNERGSERSHLLAFGLRYQLGSRSSSRRRIRELARHHGEKQIRCHHKVLYCASCETIKDDQQPSMFLVDARPHEIDDGDVVARLTSRTESMAEHEPQGSFEHCFVGLLKTSFFIKSENFPSRGQLLIRAREKRSICAQSTVCGFSFFI